LKEGIPVIQEIEFVGRTPNSYYFKVNLKKTSVISATSKRLFFVKKYYPYLPRDSIL
jgi:hypothetical protein